MFLHDVKRQQTTVAKDMTLSLCSSLSMLQKPRHQMLSLSAEKASPT